MVDKNKEYNDFYGGMIDPEKRGNLVAVVASEKGKDSYGAFIYGLRDEEYLHLTGVGLKQFDVVRVYAGISPEAASEVAGKINDDKLAELNLKSLDQIVVIPHFISRREVVMDI